MKAALTILVLLLISALGCKKEPDCNKLTGTYDLKTIFDTTWHALPYTFNTAEGLFETFSGTLEIDCESICTVEELSTVYEAESLRILTWCHVNDTYFKILDNSSFCVWNKCYHVWDTGYYQDKTLVIFNRKYAID